MEYARRVFSGKHPNTTTEETTPFPNTEAIASCLHVHFNNDPIVLPSDGTLYSIEQQFGTVCNSWKDKIQSGERFGPMTETNILFRSHIVNDLFAKVEKTLQYPGTGIMVKGPHGIGKSHTLVNLVLKLQSTNNYLVTFVPDCGKLNSGEQFMEAICDSFGIEVHGTGGLGMPHHRLSESQHTYAMENTIRAILKCLQAMGKKWVFVFDQVNSLFASRPDAKRIAHLEYPSYYIQNVMRNGIISIISASVNNDISFLNGRYSFDHNGFDDFDHSPEMSDDELMLCLANRWTCKSSKSLRAVCHYM